MKDKLKLVQLTNGAVDEVVFIADSVIMAGYSYVMSYGAFEQAKELFGDAGDSDEAFMEDPMGWLAAFFDFDSFDEMEDGLVKFFGGLQQMVSSLSMGSVAVENEDAVCDQVVDEDEFDAVLAEITKDIPPSVMTAPEVVKEPLPEVTKETDEQEDVLANEIKDVIDFLRTVEVTDLRTALLMLFSKKVVTKEKKLIDCLYVGVLEGLTTASRACPDETGEFVEEIMSIFIERMEK